MNKLLIIVFLYSFSLINAQSYVWPFESENTQAQVVGTIGEYRYSSSSGAHRYHRGIDLTNGNDLNVYSINTGNVSFVNGDDVWDAWTSYVLIGDLKYIHTKPIDGIRLGIITQVNSINEHISEMLTEGIEEHLHLEDNSINFLNQHLTPYIDTQVPIIEYAALPYGFAIYQNGIIKTSTDYAIKEFNIRKTINSVLYLTVYNKIDIAAHIKDYRVLSNGGGTTGQTAPYKMKYELKQNGVLLTEQSITFNQIPNNSTAIYAFHPQSVSPGSPSIHMLTCSPFTTPNDRYLNTNLKTGTTETWPANATLDALNITEAAYKDGLYVLGITGYDVDFNDSPNNSIFYHAIY